MRDDRDKDREREFDAIGQERFHHDAQLVFCGGSRRFSYDIEALSIEQFRAGRTEPHELVE